jgi:hypothetical protein
MNTKRLIILALLVALVLALAPRTWSYQQMECQDYDLTGRMFAVSYRTDIDGVVKCVYAGRVAHQCPTVAPDGTVLIEERIRVRDRVACFYAPADMTGWRGAN